MDKSKNLMIGVFVVAAIALIVFVILFIHPTVGDDGKLLHVRFANIDKVNIGTRVTFAGRPVGEVIEIREIIQEPNPRPAHNGLVYAYELTLAVDSSVDVYNTDSVALRTSGLLGDKSVNITPLPPKPGQKLRLITDQIIYADETGGVEETLKELQKLSDKIEEALDSFASTLNDVKRNKTIEKISDTFANIRDITDALNEPDKWSNTLNNVEELTENMVNSWDTVDEILDSAKTTVVKIGDTADNAKQMTEYGMEIFTKVKSGEGTVGKLLMSDDLYLRLTSILNKGEVVMNDVNHYGILFHLDKNWQRLRARRLNLLQKLCSPQQFKNYFNDEIDQISTSLSRVTMVLEDSGIPCNPCLVQDFEFSKVFSELLRRVEEMEETLKMYNIQLNEYKVRKTELSSCCH